MATGNDVSRARWVHRRAADTHARAAQLHEEAANLHQDHARGCAALGLDERVERAERLADVERALADKESRQVQIERDREAEHPY